MEPDTGNAETGSSNQSQPFLFSGLFLLLWGAHFAKIGGQAEIIPLLPEPGNAGVGKYDNERNVPHISYVNYNYH